MRYQKLISRDVYGDITAEVVRVEDGSTAGIEFFIGYPFESEKHKMKRAHAWADGLIGILEEYEIT